MSESVTESIQRAIAEGERRGMRPVELQISDLAARGLSRELAQGLLDLNNTQAAEDTYQSMIGGSAKFMGCRIVVATDDPADSAAPG